MILPTLRIDQGEIVRDPAKVKVICMGRRYGKTVLGGTVAANVLRHHGRVAWITPTYKNSRPLWRWLNQAAAENLKNGSIIANKTDKTFETTREGFLGLYSADNIDAIRGEWFHVVVLDEAAYIPEDAWSDAIMPTLSDADGDALLIGTPKGKNWFYREFLRGLSGDGEYASWQKPTNANPMPTIQKAFERARASVSERTFRQEWLAEFIEGGQIFRFVDDAQADTWQDEPIEGHEYVAGLDWALSGDFTVLTIIDVTTKEVVYIDRFNAIDYTIQRNRIKNLANKFKVYTLVAEENAMGRPNNEILAKEGLPVQGFTTTNRTKAMIIEDLASAFDNKLIRIPKNYAPLYAELQAFEAEQLHSGLTRYNAPSGMHDDTVMSLAMGWSAIDTKGSLLLW